MRTAPTWVPFVRVVFATSQSPSGYFGFESHCKCSESTATIVSPAPAPASRKILPPPAWQAWPEEAADAHRFARRGHHPHLGQRRPVDRNVEAGGGDGGGGDGSRRGAVAVGVVGARGGGGG